LYKGKHLLIDCRHVPREVCLDDKRILDVMARAAERAGATVISQVRYRFGDDSPPGFTAFVLLDESHCSAHAYADLGLIALDVFTCGTTDPLEVLEYIRSEIDLGEITMRDLPRFAVAEPSSAERPAVVGDLLARATPPRHQPVMGSGG